MIVYNKLVRDRIPEIIEAEGKTCETRLLDPAAHLEALNQKLGEELAEYQANGEVEELADLVEIIRSIARMKGFSAESFERITDEKREKRGGFEQGIFLVSVSE